MDQNEPDSKRVNKAMNTVTLNIKENSWFNIMSGKQNKRI